ncbi:ferritin-like domain-containing protein [Microvirga tunisiensis]|uniref:Ferritin-like domain-containing protein n=2 Tax=Microvirga tunisiensis TaxID=2108360 RepID=A0A5N7MSX3_9HYPH|nr:ferritin-like domain-containing protein [Microvirga tunisiensis]MPR30102.1 ferritin-like domain-containing protein [Microvirga tunisiensis]
MDALSKLSRRQSLQSLVLFGAGAVITGLHRPTAAHAQATSPSAMKDEDIFQFALNLEYMEAEYYLRATTGKGIDAADIGADAGGVNGGRKVSFRDKAISEFADELAENELAHVRFYRKTLGSQAVARPTIDFEGGFKAVATAAGLPEFDPFANDMNFLLGGVLFEDVGVTGYAGAAPLLQNKEFVEATAAILAVEAYHMGMARAQLDQMGEKGQKAANAVSAARDKLDGPGDKDQGVEHNGKANLVPATPDGMVFRRTPQEVLRIVYLTDKAGVDSGGFYPKGMNGALKST